MLFLFNLSIQYKKGYAIDDFKIEMISKKNIYD